MLMQMMRPTEAIGQRGCEASRTIGARTFVTPVSFTHAATLCKASGSGSEGWKTRPGRFSAKWTTCSPEPLAISRISPLPGRTSRRTSRMKSRLRSVAGAYWRWSLIFLTHSRSSVRKIEVKQESTLSTEEHPEDSRDHRPIPLGRYPNGPDRSRHLPIVEAAKPCLSPTKYRGTPD